MIPEDRVRFLRALMLPALLAACSSADSNDGAAGDTSMAATTALDTSPPLATREGFSGPEAVRYDPDQDIYFVGNFNGSGSALDNNGFISRMGPDGEIVALRFIAGGTGGVTLHAPRGMTIVGDTLWVADVDAVRGFDRRTGAPLATVDFSGASAGFLNDVAPGPDGALYVTDTGKNLIYRILDGSFTTAIEGGLGSPNGITWDVERGRFIVVPYGGGHEILAWRAGDARAEPIGRSDGGKFDGVEVLPGGRILVASQTDSTLHIFTGDRGRPVIRTTGAPADIAVDTKRNRVAVPYISLDRVDIWQLPAN